MNEKKLTYLDSLEFGDLAIFCGAGISKNSGLPLADELKQSILEQLLIDNKDIDEIMSSNLPFESFIETISEHIDITRILEIFQNGEANTNHILIARLSKNGYLKTICTTNFDLLIERALESEGLKRGKDFEVYSEGEQFSEINFENIPEIIRIFKIHGSADNTKSILTTLKAVSSKALSEKRRDVIRYLFSTGRHSKVLILGYSCSDEFDITHQIQSIEENQKEILFIEHCNEVEGIEDVRIREQKNPFKKFHGKRVKCNTDNFIEDLWNSFKRTIGKYKPIESKVDWKLYIDDFIRVLKENKECFQYAIVGVTFRSISNFVKAIEYYEKALHIAQSTGDKEEELRNYGNIGNAYMRMGDFKQSLRYFSECLEISNEIGDKVVESACYLVVGTLYNRKGEFQKTVEYYKESLKTFEKLGDRSGIAASYKGLGNAYKRVGDFEKAIEQYEKALKIDKGIEAKIDQSDCYMSLGDVYYNIGYFEKAIEHYLKAEKFLHETGTIHYLEQVYRDLSLVYEKIGGEYKRPCWFSLKENGR